MWKGCDSLKLDIIYNQDCIQGMQMIPDKSIDLVVTDPPYIIETTGAGIYKRQNIQYTKELTEMKDGFSNVFLMNCVES